MPYGGNSLGAHVAVATVVAACSNAVRALRETIHYSVEGPRDCLWSRLQRN